MHVYPYFIPIAVSQEMLILITQKLKSAIKLLIPVIDFNYSRDAVSFFCFIVLGQLTYDTNLPTYSFGVGS